MRIAFFSTMGSLPWGGSEELWSRAADELLARGHEVAFSCQKWPVIADPLKRLIARGAVPHFRMRFRLGRTLRRTLETLRVTRLQHLGWLQKVKPDLVVISFACHVDNPQIAVTCRTAGYRYAIVLQAAGTNAWIGSRSWHDFKCAYQHAQQCFFVSDENREIVTSNLAVDLSRSEIIDNPFGVSLQAAPEWPAIEGHWNLACVARIHFPSKSQDLLVRVLRQPKWRARRIRVTLWGADDGFLPQLQRLIDLYDLQDQLAYGGFADDIEALWARHHALLLPSRLEGNALSLIEAMICGRVPITTRVGRADELIDDGECGFLAPAATAELVDDVLERAWQRRDEWRVMGQRAAAAIRKRHSLRPGADFADRILELASGMHSVRRLAA
jgi:glycosyltransferase involved in cell wall biosynthesis